MSLVNNTYNETLTSSKPQLENPTSIALEMPTGANLEIFISQGTLMKGIFIVLWYIHRKINDKKNFQSK